MPTPFDYDDYKPFLAEAAKAAELPLARIAEAAGVHRQYLTQVLRHKSQLSDEQAFRIGDFLGLGGGALEYFLLLVQEAKSTGAGARRYFEGRRAALRAAAAELSSELPQETTVVRAGASAAAFSEFYLDLTLQLCHAHLFIPAFQREPRRLEAKLGLSPAALDAALERLRAMGLVEAAPGRLQSLMSLIHLEKDSLISQQNHRNWRIYAAHVPMTRQASGFFFSSTVTSEPRIRKALVAKLRATIAELHGELAGTKDEEVFQVNLDVFAL